MNWTSISLPLYLARVLLLLKRQQLRESHLPADSRGWITRERLAQLAEEASQYLVSANSMGTYAARLQKMVQDRLGRDAVFIEFKRNLGMRLVKELDIVDGTQPAQQGGSDWQLYFPVGTGKAAFLIVRTR